MYRSARSTFEDMSMKFRSVIEEAMDGRKWKSFICECVSRTYAVFFHVTMALAREKKKRGTQSDFQGKRGEFLTAWSDEYTEASRQKTLPDLWQRLFPQYWWNFNWRLKLTEEPEGDVVVDMGENWKSPATTEILTPEEKLEKGAIMKATEKVSRNASVGDLRLI